MVGLDRRCLSAHRSPCHTLRSYVSVFSPASTTSRARTPSASRYAARRAKEHVGLALDLADLRLSHTEIRGKFNLRQTSGQANGS